MGSKYDRAYHWLKSMYADNYYPRILVNRVRAELEGVVGWLELGEHDADEIQAEFDKMTKAINELAGIFYENDSELDTNARNAIAIDVISIIKYFELPIKVDAALRLRTW